MANNLITYPFNFKIGSSQSTAFPGAYIVRGSTGANGLIPIYASMANFGSNGMTDILNDKNAFVIVLPGFNLTLYTDPNYQGASAAYDNRNGTDVSYCIAKISTTANTASSCKLFSNFRTGYIEVIP